MTTFNIRSKYIAQYCMEMFNVQTRYYATIKRKRTFLYYNVFNECIVRNLSRMRRKRTVLRMYLLTVLLRIN